eukprot:XP_025010470.1 uncharacterized protein LOC107054353 isoform X1 [Gallus gallus]
MRTPLISLAQNGEPQDALRQKRRRCPTRPPAPRGTTAHRNPAAESGVQRSSSSGSAGPRWARGAERPLRSSRRGRLEPGASREPRAAGRTRPGRSAPCQPAAGTRGAEARRRSRPRHERRPPGKRRGRPRPRGPLRPSPRAAARRRAVAFGAGRAGAEPTTARPSACPANAAGGRRAPGEERTRLPRTASSSSAVPPTPAAMPARASAAEEEPGRRGEPRPTPPVRRHERPLPPCRPPLQQHAATRGGSWRPARCRHPPPASRPSARCSHRATCGLSRRPTSRRAHRRCGLPGPPCLPLPPLAGSARAAGAGGGCSPSGRAAAPGFLGCSPSSGRAAAPGLLGSRQQPPAAPPTSREITGWQPRAGSVRDGRRAAPGGIRGW